MTAFIQKGMGSYSAHFRFLSLGLGKAIVVSYGSPLGREFLVSMACLGKAGDSCSGSYFEGLNNRESFLSLNNNQNTGIHMTSV